MTYEAGLFPSVVCQTGSKPCLMADDREQDEWKISDLGRDRLLGVREKFRAVIYDVSEGHFRTAVLDGISKRDAPRPFSTVLIDVLHPTTLFQQVHGWRGDFDDQIGAMVEDLDAFEPKQISPVPATILEGQPFAVAPDILGSRVVCHAQVGPEQHPAIQWFS
jgi:hypothetical protein